MQKRIKITAIIPEVSHGLFYQRLRIPWKKVDSLKFDIQITTFDDPFVHYDNKTDIFVLAHPSQHEELELVEGLKKAGKKVIIDIDDLLTDLPNGHPESDLLQHCKWQVPEILMRSDYVVTSTEYLKRTYNHLNKNMSVIENSLDSDLIPKDYKPQKKPYQKGFVVGWCGGKTHIDDQYEFVFGLERFLAERMEARAHFKGLMPQRLANRFGTRCFFDPKIIHYLDYPQWLGTVPWSVCLVGLVEHPFNHGKSDLRFIECARHKIPIICSPMDDFKKHIEAGRSFEASTNEGFYNILSWLLDRPEMLEAAGQISYDYVINNRLDEHAAKKWEEVFLRVV